MRRAGIPEPGRFFFGFVGFAGGAAGGAGAFGSLTSLAAAEEALAAAACPTPLEPAPQPHVPEERGSAPLRHPLPLARATAGLPEIAQPAPVLPSALAGLCQP